MAARHPFAKVCSVRALESFRPYVFDLACALHFHGHASRLAFRAHQTQQGNGNLAITGAAPLAGDDEPRGPVQWLQECDREFAVFHFPIRHHRAQNLIDGDLVGNFDLRFARCALRNLQIYLRVDGSRILPEPHKLGQRPAQSQRLRSAVVLRFSSPRERQRLVAPAIRNPLAFRLGFGLLRQ